MLDFAPMRIPTIAMCLLLTACGGQEPSTITSVLEGSSWDVHFGPESSTWTANWSDVTIKSGQISGSGKITHDSAVWAVVVGGHIVGDTHATVRMDLIPGNDAARPAFVVFCEVDLASMDVLEGYATASTTIGSGAMINGSTLHAQKR